MDRKQSKTERREMEWLETPLHTLLGLAPTTYKQMLEPKYLQKHVRNKPANKPWIRKQRNY